MGRIFYSILWLVLIYTGIFLGNYSPSWLSKPKRTIDFFCWGDTIETELLDEFEREYGIQVKIHPFSSNEEMIVKLKATQGKGYDLVCASDYAIRILKEEKLIAPLNHKEIANISDIDPHLLGLNFDPDNSVSLPVEWEPYVIVTREEPSKLKIKDLFQDQQGKKVVMTPDPVEAIMYAAYTLYGKVDHLDEKQLKEVSKLLKKQKKHIEAYVDHRAKYLIETDNCDLALIRCGFARLMEKDKVPIYYNLPDDWHFMNIENLAMTSATKKHKDVHTFINFFLSHRCQKHHSDHTLVFSVRKDLGADSPIVQKIHEKNDPQFFQYLAKEEDTRDLWVSLKGHDPN
ncbi:MAG: extracellular solute-binding protein [Verrucomicrobia bacterium]|nr:extracellular solute-binding protein [Verrucomicrobiota bacterium]NDE63450.1 extracellular solute-binding protein [Chlamydiota bacterium]